MKFFKNQKGDINIWSLIVIPAILIISTILYNNQTVKTSYRKSIQQTLDGTALYLSTHSNIIEIADGDETYDVLDYVKISGEPSDVNDEGIFREVFYSMLKNTNIHKALIKIDSKYTDLKIAEQDGVFILVNPYTEDNNNYSSDFTSVSFYLFFKIPGINGLSNNGEEFRATVSTRGGVS